MAHPAATTAEMLIDNAANEIRVGSKESDDHLNYLNSSSPLFSDSGAVDKY